MARLLAVSVYDRALGSFARPFFTPTFGIAERSFIDAVLSKEDESPMSKYPGDFSLYHVGFFEEGTGRLEALDIPALLCKAEDVIDSQRRKGDEAAES